MKPAPGSTGPPTNTWMVPVTPSAGRPIAARRLATLRAATGRLSTMPSAPPASWRTIRITVWANRGSPICGVAIRSWPRSDATPGWPGDGTGSAAGMAGSRMIRQRSARANQAISDAAGLAVVDRRDVIAPRAQALHLVVEAEPFGGVDRAAEMKLRVVIVGFGMARIGHPIVGRLGARNVLGDLGMRRRLE